MPDTSGKHPSCRYLLVLGLWFWVFVPVAAAEKPLWLVLTRPMFVEAIRPLANHRTRQGFQTEIRVDDVKTALAGRSTKPAYILLAGDFQPGQETADWSVAGRVCRLYRWRASQREYYVSDMLWGDLDADGTPDVPVGRLPVRTAAELKLLVDRTIAYENQPMRRSDLGLAIWTGAPDFSPILDAMVTQMGWQVGQANAPKWMDLWVILANAAHPLCGLPTEQPERFSRQMQAGGVLSAMVGHGSESHFFSMRDREDDYVVYQADHGREFLSPDQTASPLVIISCYCGDFGGKEPCLAESLLLTKGGPPAVIGATTESQPLSNYYSSVSLLKALDGDTRRLGDLWLAAQQRMLRMRDFILEPLLQNIEGSLDEEISIDRLKRDQMRMYAVLADPALRLRLPERLDVEFHPDGQGGRWQAAKPPGADQLVLEYRAAKLDLALGDPNGLPPDTRQRFDRANERLRYQMRRQFPADQPWQGILTEPGRWRLVAECPDRVYVAVLDIPAAIP
ncbi:MAG: hypothetical protein JW810_10105 [Sedimentisphaerales bacterium]|nr:hypothetical protein [Sedimentisphaerales bacterium]